MSAVAKPRRIPRADGTVAYRVLIRIGGRSRSITRDTKTECEKAARKARDELKRAAERTSSQEMKDVTLAQLIVSHIEKHDVRGGKLGQLRWWSEQLGSKRLCDITSDDVAMALERLAREPAGRGDILGRKSTVEGKRRSPATLNRYQSALSSAYSKTYRWLKPSDNPCREIRSEREPAGRNRWLRDEERRKLLEACAASEWQGLGVMVQVALGTGMRAGEIVGLHWGQVDLAGGLAHLINTKNGDSRTVPIVGPAKVALERWKRTTIGTGLVFPGTTPHKPMDWRSHWNKARDAAGLQDFRFHDLRHSCASYLIQQGISTIVVAKILGHRTLAMTRRYSHLEVEHQADALEQISERLAK